MLADERNVMSTMDMEHQQQLVELEQRHQEKVLYLLNQLQNKSVCAESDETKQKDEDNAKETELLQRLKDQEEELQELNQQNQTLLEQNEQYKQKFSLLHLACTKKVLTPSANNENSLDDSFEYVPPKPKSKRFTTAKAPGNMTINIEELMSPSEEENDEEGDEWHPDKLEKGRRNSKKSKTTGCTCKGRCINKQCRCRKGKMTCGENCQCDHEKCRNMDHQVSAEDVSQTESVSRDSPSLRDPTAVSPDNSTFFKPPSCTPTKKVLKEMGDMGHSTADLKLVRKPILAEEEEEEEDDDGRTTVSILKKKKRLLTSFQNSFFSGCTPIREES